MFPTMYGIQSQADLRPQNRGNGHTNTQNMYEQLNKGANSRQANKESYSIPGNQQGRLSDYSDYGSYDYGAYGADKSAKDLGYGYGAQSYGSYAHGYGKQCPGISIALLLISLLGIALMGYILWSKIVAAGRRKRDLADMTDYWWVTDNILPILINGNLYNHSVKYRCYRIQG